PVSAMAGIVAALAGGLPLSAAAAAAPRIARVRAHGDPAIAVLLEGGMKRAPTFRRFGTGIDGTDGLGYVENGNCGHQLRACLPSSAPPAGPDRVLRILVDTRRSPEELGAAIGHELQHAIEVLNDRFVRNTDTFIFLFERIGWRQNGTFETHAAVQAGL